MSEPDQARPRMRAPGRVVLLWSVVGALLLAALGSAIGALSQSVYSPGGLVTAYLGALSRHDAQAALALPGVEETPRQLQSQGLPTRASRELLRADLLTRLENVRVAGAHNLGNDRFRVTATYRLDGHPHRSSYVLERDGSVLGIFGRWRFAASPLAVARISVLHASTFTIGGHTVDTRAAPAPLTPRTSFNTAADYLVFAPSTLRLGHASPLVTARTLSTAVTKPAAVTRATVTTTATHAFVSMVRRQLHRLLDDCVTQKVLNPTGCPMGMQIADRVRGVPEWRMVSYPNVRVVGGTDAWTMPPTGAVAHLTVHVQSLFDGSMSTRDEDVPFTVSLSRITIKPHGSVEITMGD